MNCTSIKLHTKGTTNLVTRKVYLIIIDSNTCQFLTCVSKNTQGQICMHSVIILRHSHPFATVSKKL